MRDLLGGAWLRPAMRRWAEEAPERIALTLAQRDLLQRDWHYRHARFDDLPDGRAVMTYGEDEAEQAFRLVRWLGPGAEIVSPPAWRRRFRDDLLRMAADHDGPSGVDD